jgi:type IV fimbrial biogenesis protein FimT
MVIRRPARRMRGFTLPELVAVVAIVAILAAAAAPAFGKLVAGQRARATVSDLHTALLLARSEAVKRNTEVTLRPVVAGTWNSGWIVPNPADTGHPIAVHPAAPGATITGPDAVVYLANGRIKGATPPAFDVSYPDLDGHRCVQADLGGRPLTTRGGC